MSDPVTGQSESLFDDPFEDALPEEQAELRALKQSLQLGAQSPGFRLIFARCNVAPYQELLIRRLQTELSDLTIQHIHFDEKIDHLLDQLHWRVAEPMPDAVFVTGLENSYSAETQRPRQSPLILNLNASRNSFPRYVPRPLVLWLPETMLTALFHGAPDFFSVRSGLYSFYATFENTGNIAGSVINEAGLQTDSLAEAEKWNRVSLIRSLLADYKVQPESKPYEVIEPYLLLQLASLQESLSQAGESLQSYNRVIQLARQTGDQKLESAALSGLGVAYADLGEIRKAIECYEKALSISRRLANVNGEIADLINLGNAYADLGETDKAEDFNKKALLLARKINDQRHELVSLTNLSSLYVDLGDLTRAIQFNKEALSIARQIGDRRNEAKTLGNLGIAYAESGQSDTAIEFYKKQLTLTHKLGDKRSTANALLNIGQAKASLGKIQEAIESYQQALEIYTEIKDKAGQGAALGNIGTAHAILRQANQAIEYLQRSLLIAREVKDQSRERLWLKNLGDVYRRLGQEKKESGELMEAIGFFDQASSFHREANDISNESINLGLIGSIYFILNNPMRAVEYFDLAVLAAQRAKNEKLEAEQRWWVSQAWEAAGERRRAITAAEEALKLAESHKQELAEEIRRKLENWRGVEQPAEVAPGD